MYSERLEAQLFELHGRGAFGEGLDLSCRRSSGAVSLPVRIAVRRAILSPAVISFSE